MTKRGSTLFALATLFAALCAAPYANADAPVTRRLVLPLDGSPLDLAPLAYAPGGRIRFVIEGAVFSTVDGSSFDAFSRRVGDRVVQEDGGFIVLPPGARMIESDPLAHRYVIEIDALPSAPIAFATSKLVARYLLPRSEVVERLDGDIMIEVLTPPRAVVGSGALQAARGAPDLGEDDALGSFLALVALPLPLLLLLRRTPEERRQLRRIGRALRAIDAEARRLGPAFLPVIDAAKRVSETARGIGRDVERARAAFRRTAWVESGAAAERRRRVQDREQDLVRRLSSLAEQFEVLATELAAVDLEGVSTAALAERLRELTHELDEAVAARQEAEKVGV